MSNTERQRRWRAKRPDVVERALTRAAERCVQMSAQERRELADQLADAAVRHLHRSQQLAVLARRVRAIQPNSGAV